MMRVAVLASAESWYWRDLIRAARPDERLARLSFRELAGTVRTGEISVGDRRHLLGEFDTVLVRTMPPGSLEQVVLRMDLLAGVEAVGTPVVNPPRAIEVAVDKYLCLARLASAGMPVPPTVACQTVTQAMRAFEQFGGDVVVKPLFGSEGRGLVRLNDAGLAERALALLSNLAAVLYVQQFVPHQGYDYRALVIGDRLLAIRRANPHDWRTNISRGATAEAVHLDPQMENLARQAAAATGAVLAGVDLLPSRDGRVYVLEVNAVPGWRALAAAHRVDVARLVLDDLRWRCSRR
jgi:RimK family alpha-L-glutamate ligase